MEENRRTFHCSKCGAECDESENYSGMCQRCFEQAADDDLERRREYWEKQ
jgi:NMD protein affecting ribosome stability and mRNA decay